MCYGSDQLGELHPQQLGEFAIRAQVLEPKVSWWQGAVLHGPPLAPACQGSASCLYPLLDSAIMHPPSSYSSQARAGLLWGCRSWCRRPPSTALASSIWMRPSARYSLTHPANSSVAFWVGQLSCAELTRGMSALGLAMLLGGDGGGRIGRSSRATRSAAFLCISSGRAGQDSSRRP